MEKLKIDLGVKEYEINGRGVLRFSPTDPGLYSRLANFTEQLEEKQKELKMLDDLTDGTCQGAGPENGRNRPVFKRPAFVCFW